jgi:hypothetical protein
MNNFTIAEDFSTQQPSETDDAVIKVKVKVSL